MNDIKCLDSLLAKWFSYYDYSVIDTFENRKILNVCWGIICSMYELQHIDHKQFMLLYKAFYESIECSNDVHGGINTIRNFIENKQ